MKTVWFVVIVTALWRVCPLTQDTVQRGFAHGTGVDSGRAVIKQRPTNTRYWPNVVLMAAHRLWRWPNIKTTLLQYLAIWSMSCICCPNVVVMLANIKTTLGQCHAIWSMSCGYCCHNVAMSCVWWGQPSKTRQSSNVGSMLGQRCGRWTNNKPAMGQWLGFSGRRHSRVNSNSSKRFFYIQFKASHVWKNEYQFCQ